MLLIASYNCINSIGMRFTLLMAEKDFLDELAATFFGHLHQDFGIIFFLQQLTSESISNELLTKNGQYLFISDQAATCML